MTNLAEENTKLTNVLKHAEAILGHGRFARGERPAGVERQHFRLRQAVRQAIKQLRAVAEPVGTDHVYWRAITELQAQLDGVPTGLDYSTYPPIPRPVTKPK